MSATVKTPNYKFKKNDKAYFLMYVSKDIRRIYCGKVIDNFISPYDGGVRTNVEIKHSGGTCKLSFKESDLFKTRKQAKHFIKYTKNAKKVKDSKCVLFAL